MALDFNRSPFRQLTQSGKALDGMLLIIVLYCQ